MKETFTKFTSITALLLLLLSSSALALDHNKSKEVIELNNIGVKYLEQREFDQAIAYLKKATAMDPDYLMARSNLAIAINNKGLDVYEKGSAEGGLHLMETSYFNDPTNKTTRYNLEGIIRVLKLNPDSPLDRCGLSGKAILRGDNVAAWVELCAAYEKLHDILFPPKLLPHEPEESLNYDEKPEVFYKKYIKLLDKRIHDNLNPPKENNSYVETILISVKNNGQMSVTTPDRHSERFAAFKSAVEKSNPAPKLYKDQKDIKIQFTLKYTVLKQ